MRTCGNLKRQSARNPPAVGTLDRIQIQRLINIAITKRAEVVRDCDCVLSGELIVVTRLKSRVTVIREIVIEVAE